MTIVEWLEALLYVLVITHAAEDDASPWRLWWLATAAPSLSLVLKGLWVKGIVGNSCCRFDQWLLCHLSCAFSILHSAWSTWVWLIESGVRGTFQANTTQLYVHLPHVDRRILRCSQTIHAHDELYTAAQHTSRNQSIDVRPLPLLQIDVFWATQCLRSLLPKTLVPKP